MFMCMCAYVFAYQEYHFVNYFHQTTFVSIYHVYLHVYLYMLYVGIGFSTFMSDCAFAIKVCDMNVPQCIL